MLGVLDLISTLLCIRLWVSPADFGAATLAIAVFPIVDRLGGMGLGAALVRDPDAEPTVFWLNLGVASAVLGGLALARPVVALISHQPIIGSLLVAYGVRLVVQVSSVVPEARMRRALRFGELSGIRVIAGVCETAAKLGLAYAGAHGHPALRVWCFALGPVVNTLVTSCCVLAREPWRPRLAFSRDAARAAARFAGSISGGELLYYAYTSADYLVVGAYFGDAAVGVYRLAYELVIDVVRLVSMVTAEVAYPAFARLVRQDARGEIGAQLIRFTRQNAFALAPVLVVIGLEADDLLAALYGPLPAAAALAARILCAVGALRVLSFVIPPMLAGIGDARRVLAYHAVALVVLPAAFAIGGALGGDVTGVAGVAWGWAAGYPIAFAVLLALALPRAQVTLGAYARALARVVACAAVAALAGECARGLPAGPTRLAVVATIVVLVYAAMLAWLEGVTPRSLARSFAAAAPGPAATARATAPSPGT